MALITRDDDPTVKHNSEAEEWSSLRTLYKFRIQKQQDIDQKQNG